MQAAMRDGMLRATVYNEGLSVFLCDHAERTKLRKKLAPLWSGKASPGKQDALLRELAKVGEVLAYQLIQDDELDVGVSVGAPLSEAEQQGLPWLVSPPALLHLPSGGLSIDSLNTIEPGAEDKPAALKVPPGSYLVRVHWVDLAKAEGRIDGPTQILTLTPTDAKTWDAAVPRLDPSGEAPAPPAAGALVVAEHKRNDRQVEIIFTGVEGVELVRGDHLVLTAGDLRADTFFHDYRYPGSYGYFFGEERWKQLEAACLQASWAHVSQKGRPIPAVSVTAGTHTPFAKHPIFDLPVGAHVELQRAPEPYEKPTPLPKCKVKDGEAQCQVMASHPLMLALNLNYGHPVKNPTPPWLDVEVAGQHIIIEDERPPAERPAQVTEKRPAKFRYESFWDTKDKSILCITPARAPEGEQRTMLPVFPVGAPVIVRPVRG